MQNIVGQSKLLTAINSYTIQTLPKSLMFIGPSGCGKHTIAKYIAEKFDFDYVEIIENVSTDDLTEYTYKTINTLYLIDLNKFSEKQQNQFLKFIEEPSKTVYTVLITNSEANTLGTIINRCIKYTFESYAKEQIEAITNTSVNDLAFKIFQTPGKLLNLTEDSFKNIITLAEEVVHKISYMPYTNTLAISTKINYKDLYNKIDFNLFFDTIEYLALEDYKINKNDKSLVIFNLTNKFKQYSTKQNLIKEMLMINYLTTLWEAVQV